MILKDNIIKLLEKSVKGLQKSKKLSEFKISTILIEKPKENSHADYSTNLALQIAKITKKNPIEIAKLIESRIMNYESGIFEKIEIARPGFINFFISKEYLQKQIKEILKQKKM